MTPRILSAFAILVIGATGAFTPASAAAEDTPLGDRTWKASFETNVEETANPSTVLFGFDMPSITRCTAPVTSLDGMEFGSAATSSVAVGKWCEDQCRRCALSAILFPIPDPIACYNCLHLCRIYSPVIDKPVVYLAKEEDI